MIRYFSHNFKHKDFEAFVKDFVMTFFILWDDDEKEKVFKISLIRYPFKKLHAYEITSTMVHEITLKFPKNREELNKFTKRIQNNFRYLCEWEDLRKDLRRLYNSSLQKNWEIVLPDKIALWASWRLQELSRHESCCDNFRVARVGNTSQERRYRRQVNRGCCGFYDIIDVCPEDGKAYRLGFNYGH